MAKQTSTNVNKTYFMPFHATPSDLPLLPHPINQYKNIYKRMLPNDDP